MKLVHFLHPYLIYFSMVRMQIMISVTQPYLNQYRRLKLRVRDSVQPISLLQIKQVHTVNDDIDNNTCYLHRLFYVCIL